MKKQIKEMVYKGLLSQQELYNYYKSGLFKYMEYLVLQAVVTGTKVRVS